MKSKSAARQLDSFIARYTPEIGSLARAALAKMRACLPGAVQLVYENYNALAIGFSPTEHTPDIILSITLYPRWVSLFFRRGAELPDPRKLLKGTGTTMRHIVLHDAADLDQPAVSALIDHAVQNASKSIDSTSPNRIIVKLVSEIRRPRRPTK